MDSQNVSSGTVGTTLFNGSSTASYNGSSSSIYNGSFTTMYNKSTMEETTYNLLIISGSTIVCLCSILCNSLALNIINRCRKQSYQMRFVSNNLLASFIAFDSSAVLHNFAMLLVGDVYYKQIFDSRVFFASVLVPVLWASLCAVTVERLLAITIPLYYQRFVTKTILFISITCLWAVNVLAPGLVFIITGITVCGYDYISCDIFALFLPLQKVILVFLLLYSLIVFISYVKILSIIFHHHKLGRTLIANAKYLADISQKQKVTDSTKTVAVVILAFILFQSPMYLHSILLELKPEFRQHKLRILFQFFDFVGVELNTYATLYLYIWKFKECKMHLFFLMSKLNKTFKARANDLHIEVFDIVTINNKHRKMRDPNI